MANNMDPRLGAFGARAPADAGYDAGLRSYMLSIYNYMASGVLLTGIVALLVYSTPALFAVFFNQIGSPTILGWIAIASPLVMILAMNFGIHRMSEATLKMMFWAFAALMGVSMSTIFARYTGASIAQTFFITAASFGGLSLFGYTTKKDLSAMGRFLMMGLIGIIIAMIANIFIKSSGLQLAVNILGVLIFAGLTAYDTQRLRDMYYQLQGSDFAGKAAVMGALTLYLNFINLFQFLLSFMGNRD
ncbi:Bax inhibitor-1/YccA family protein [Sandarakinorhabdus sp. AAP62]|uniref:Bax inhibitor-1/YccA family protein n=1 Tax=Sandarakinorhabdus sp. AAP62 TaxID=1248916 RepID=UPI0002D502FD|nr:Bax inhibitor-1/YccA family protein [Sandarakinorhabdus sp. AAP62]